MSFRVPSQVLLDDAAAVLLRGIAAISSGEQVIDLTDVTASDSSLVACLLAWRRAAQSRGVSLSVGNPPERVRALATLYGVGQIALD